MGLRGPPKGKKDWENIKAMSQIQCTHAEIAAVHNCCVKTLDNACKEVHGMTFAKFYEIHRQGGHSSLRRKQWKLADKFPAMAIFLGKNYLSQKDKHEIESFVNVQEQDLSKLSTDELEQLRALQLKIKGAPEASGALPVPTDAEVIEDSVDDLL